jgi:hypothetical protein
MFLGRRSWGPSRFQICGRGFDSFTACQQQASQANQVEACCVITFIMGDEQVRSLRSAENRQNRVRLPGRPPCACGARIPSTITVDGTKRNLKNRKRCLVCSPFKPLGEVVVPVPRESFSECVLCGARRDKRLCPSCRTKVHRVRLKASAVAFLGGKCSDCGWHGHQSGFDFHHEGDKDFAISTASYMAWDRVKAELLKCALLCALCHRLRHERRSAKLMDEALEGFEPYC